MVGAIGVGYIGKMLNNSDLDTCMTKMVKLDGLNIPTRRHSMNVSDQYWAGFFDGEGCVSPQKYVSKIHNEKFIVAIKVAVSQKETMILYLMQKRYGGYVHVRPVVTVNGTHTTVGHWELTRAEGVIAFLESIKPYAIVKAVEIAIALDILTGVVKSRENYSHHMKDGKSYLSGKKPIELSEIKRRQELEKKFYEDRGKLKEVEIVATLKDAPISNQ